MKKRLVMMGVVLGLSAFAAVAAAVQGGPAPSVQTDANKPAADKGAAHADAGAAPAPTPAPTPAPKK